MAEHPRKKHLQQSESHQPKPAKSLPTRPRQCGLYAIPCQRPGPDPSLPSGWPQWSLHCESATRLGWADLRAEKLVSYAPKQRCCWRKHWRGPEPGTSQSQSGLGHCDCFCVYYIYYIYIYNQYVKEFQHHTGPAASSQCPCTFPRSPHSAGLPMVQHLSQAKVNCLTKLFRLW